VLAIQHDIIIIFMQTKRSRLGDDFKRALYIPNNNIDNVKNRRANKSGARRVCVYAVCVQLRSINFRP
jgi:hypothetical protein